MGTQSGKSGKAGKRRNLSSKKGSSSACVYSEKIQKATTQGYFMLSDECSCPCLCPAPQAVNAYVMNNSSGKSGKKSSKSGGTVYSYTVRTPATHNHACICDNIGTSSVTYNTVYTTSGKSKAGKRRRLEK